MPRGSSGACPTCGGRGWHTAGGNDPMACGNCRAGQYYDESVLVYCRFCNKTHAVLIDETPCAPGAWTDEATGLKFPPDPAGQKRVHDE